MIERIRNRFDQLSKTEQKVAQYVLNHAELVPTMTTKELANKAAVSEASVIRFSKAVGVESFKAFKIALAEKLATTKEYLTDFSIIHKKDAPYELFQKVVHVNQGAIDLLRSSVSKRELDRAIDALMQARKVVFFGVGGSTIAAMDALYKFTKLGFQAEFSQDFHYMLSLIPYLNEQDVFVAISMSGRTKDVLELAEFAQNKGAKLIAITNISKSPLYKMADIVLATPVVEKDFRIGSMTSRMTQLTMIDSVYLTLFHRVGKEVITQYHEARDEMVKLRR